MNSDEFWSKVELVDGHGIWTGTIGADGYARVFVDGWLTYVHIYAWVSRNDPVPEGLELGHTCEHRHCVLCVRPISHIENIRESWPAMKTHCDHGHEYTPENTYIHPQRGTRSCKKCQRQRVREHRKKVVS